MEISIVYEGTLKHAIREGLVKVASSHVIRQLLEKGVSILKCHILEKEDDFDDLLEYLLEALGKESDDATFSSFLEKSSRRGHLILIEDDNIESLFGNFEMKVIHDEDIAKIDVETITVIELGGTIKMTGKEHFEFKIMHEIPKIAPPAKPKPRPKPRPKPKG